MRATLNPSQDAAEFSAAQLSLNDTYCELKDMQLPE